MKVIMLEHIQKVGNKGDIVNVKRGFARNYLIPRNYAQYATPLNMKNLSTLKTKFAEEESKRYNELLALSEKISNIQLTFSRKVDENDHMFGSVSELDIVSALKEQGIELQKSAIHMEKHIKELGEFTVPVKLHKDINTNIRGSVEKEAE